VREFSSVAWVYYVGDLLGGLFAVGLWYLIGFFKIKDEPENEEFFEETVEENVEEEVNDKL